MMNDYYSLSSVGSKKFGTKTGYLDDCSFTVVLRILVIIRDYHSLLQESGAILFSDESPDLILLRSFRW
jgi:hypothetical protein